MTTHVFHQLSDQDIQLAANPAEDGERFPDRILDAPVNGAAAKVLGGVGLEDRLRTSAHDRIALQRLPGRKVLLTNAPRHYALRVMRTLNLLGCFDAVLCVEDMRMFGHWRPKPDVRMFRHVCARLKVRPAQCVLVEDTLEHQQAARSLGMRTVWMQRYLRSAAQAAPARPGAPRRCIKPPYVCARIHRVQTLLAPW